MELTKNQKALIHALKFMGVDREDTVAIMMLMETDEMADKMLDWLVSMKDVDLTFSDLMGMALTLNKKFSKK